MASVQSTSSTPSQALLDSVNGTTGTTKSAVEQAQDRFMTLLITQMKNQDPLNPMDNAQVTSQMAQLSTVTGIDKLNATVESLMSGMQATQSYQAANMIGHNVLAEGNTVTSKGSGGYFGVELLTGADKLNVKIKDSAGATIRTMSLGAQNSGNIPLKWDGLNDAGVAAASGTYQFEIAATVAGRPVKANPLNYAEVTSVSSGKGGVKLNLSNLASINTSDVKEIF